MLPLNDDVRKPGPLLQMVHKFNDSLGLDRDKDYGSQDYNLAQIKRYAIYGCLIAGPALHIWFVFILIFVQLIILFYYFFHFF